MHLKRLEWPVLSIDICEYLCSEILYLWYWALEKSQKAALFLFHVTDTDFMIKQSWKSFLERYLKIEVLQIAALNLAVHKNAHGMTSSRNCFPISNRANERRRGDPGKRKLSRLRMIGPIGSKTRMFVPIRNWIYRLR